MANLILGNSSVSDALKFYSDLTSGDILTSEVNKLWRAKILLDRKTRPAKTGATNTINSQEKARKQNVRPTPVAIAYDDNSRRAAAEIEQSTNVTVNRAFKEAYRNEVEVRFRHVDEDSDGTSLKDPSVYDHHLAAKENTQIRLYNMNVSPVQYIVLQTIPKEIEFQGESTWAVIRSMGRNTPMYHFTGAETVIQMNISWYANDKSNPEEVVAKCRLLESWTKADGYVASPPILELQWGDSDLFKDQKFILTAATYKLSNWKATAKERLGGSEYTTKSGYAEPKMYPSVATQELILRRVSANNLSHNDILPQSWKDRICFEDKSK